MNADNGPLPLNNFSKVSVKDGVIYYKLYAQDSTFIPMTCEDTLSNQLFVSWVQKFDRYTVAGSDLKTREGLA